MGISFFQIQVPDEIYLKFLNIAKKNGYSIRSGKPKNGTKPLSELRNSIGSKAFQEYMQKYS